MSEPWKRRVEIGNAVLYEGDCLEIFPHLPKVDAVVTDPPYGIGESSKRNATRGGIPGGKKNPHGTYVPPTDYGEYVWDDEPADYSVIAWIIDHCDKTIIWGGNYFSFPPNSKWLVWDKINSGDFADCELAWTSLPGAVRIFRHMWNGMLRDSERGTPRVHPTQKPIALMAWCIDQCRLQAHSLILDAYMGSGTCGIAAFHAGHRFLGIEKSPRYFDIACRRIEDAYRQGKLFPDAAAKPVQEVLL